MCLLAGQLLYIVSVCKFVLTEKKFSKIVPGVLIRQQNWGGGGGIVFFPYTHSVFNLVSCGVGKR